MTRAVPRLRLDLSGPEPVRIERPDTVVVEEPLEIHIAGVSVTSMMRTPGDDFDLVLGHLLGEGLIARPDDVAAMMHCTDVDEDGVATFNVVDVTLAPGVGLRREPTPRAETASSACGVCGQQSIDDLLDRVPSARPDNDLTLAASDVAGLLDHMRSRQKVFARTGGVHAAALFSADGELVALREDIGRHNAVDKVIGAAARAQVTNLHEHLLVVSSRAGFEIVQKAAVAGIPIVVAVSAASSLAVELAERTGMTLVAFARERTLSAYSGIHRVTVPLLDSNQPRL